MSVLNRNHLDSAETVKGTRMVQTYKIAVLGDGGVGKSGKNSNHNHILDNKLHMFSMVNIIIIDQYNPLATIQWNGTPYKGHP